MHGKLEPIVNVSDSRFRDRHPLLYHLQQHHRIYTSAALAFVFLLWLVIGTGLVRAKVKRLFHVDVVRESTGGSR